MYFVGLQPRWRAEHAPLVVVQDAYVHGETHDGTVRYVKALRC